MPDKFAFITLNKIFTLAKDVNQDEFIFENKSKHVINISDSFRPTSLKYVLLP